MSSAVEWPINNEGRYREHKLFIELSQNLISMSICPFSEIWLKASSKHMWCVARFKVSHCLTFAWLFERMWMHANAFILLSCRFYPFAWFSMAFERVYQMTNVWMPFKRVNTSNLMTFECCFLISWYHENCNAMSSFTVLRHVPWNTFICSAVQCFH